ncbi:MAG: 2OG-Fe dioxygenase family protein [Bacteroidota bacterium]
MITEKEISAKLGREIKSPIRVGQLSDLKMSNTTFIETLKPFFDELEDDLYLVKENQIAYLKKIFHEDSLILEDLRKEYFHGAIGLDALNSWVFRLDEPQKQVFESLSQITRQRNIATFMLYAQDSGFSIERLESTGFEQNVDDFRTWERVFKEAEPKMVENELFFRLLLEIGSLVKSIHPEVKRLKVTSHFMRTISYEKIRGENAPEGIHEDGAKYIMSALVVNRTNCKGAESQIFEKLGIDKHDTIYTKTLEPGEFIFQADTGEEKTFGNDLWHYVTPLQPLNAGQTGVRDIVGFDIDLFI